MRTYPWASHPLGEPDRWPQSLKSAVSICLGSRFPILLWWGPELFMLYNDAYRPMLGALKHPRSLGQRGRECWGEIWTVIGPMLEETVLARGEATWSNDQLLLVDRNGFTEEAYFTFTYSPIRDESDRVGGVFCAVIETTDRVVGDRRIHLLKEIAALASDTRDEPHVCAAVAATLERCPADLAFAALYRQDGDGAGVLVAHTSGTPADLPRRTGPDMPLAIAPPHARVPFDVPGHPDDGGLLVAGINPQRPLDAAYRAFLDDLGAHIGRVIADARAFEAERARAESLAALDKAKTDFFSNVSHEFRTPLTLMLGPVQDALGSSTRTLGGEGLQTVQRNALRLLKLVNTLLDFASIEAGRAQATFEPTDLSAYTSDLAAAFRSAADVAGLSLEVQCPGSVGLVAIDRAMWQTIVFNLLSNALKYTFEGGITLSLEKRDDTIHLRVRDTGVGIAADDLPRVFERFHRIRAARARTHEGSGIGLALVQELVRLHGGTITVGSAAGQGSTFEVAIPARAHAPQAHPVDGEPRAFAAVARADAYVADALGWVAAPEEHPREAMPGVARILVADDNADMRAYLRRLLGERWQVDVVPDGAAALAAVRARRPDLLVADVMMPGMDGLELLDTLRRDPATRNVPVVLLSARAGEHATIEGVAAGADDYLVKPFSARDLLTRVEAQLARARERALVRARMAQVESIVEHAPIGVYLVDQDLRLVHVNPVARRAFGDIPDLVGRDFDEVIGRLWRTEYAEEVLSRFRHTLATGQPWVESERVEERADLGVVEYYEWRVVRMTLPDGRFGLVCYFRDISTQVRARMALARVTVASEQQRRLYETILATTPDLVYVFDRQHRFTYANRALLEMWGKTWDEANGRTFIDLGYEPWHGEMHDREIEQVIATRAPIRGEVPFSGTQGRRIYDYIFVPVIGDNGEVEAIAGTTRDVTDYKQVEEALRDREQRLADANRVKDEFLATLSHELRTPLNAVLGWAHMLRAGTLPQQMQAKAFDALERNARAQAQLVDDLLDVSRIMSGKLSMKSQRVDLGRVIGDAVDTVRPAADARRLVLDVDVKTAGQVLVLGDGARLQQVVWNLLANAVKFTPTGGSVSVTLQRDDGHADVVITDSGEGISPEFLPHVFERFQQADSAPSRKHGGLGLGLALVRHLTEAHGGTVAVHSAGRDQGATFVIRLPVLDPAAAQAHAETDMPEDSRTDRANSDESTASARQSVRS